MKRLCMILSCILLAGCVGGSYRSVNRTHAIRFAEDPINHGAEEAVEQLEFFAEPTTTFYVGPLPVDWGYSTSSDRQAPTCTLSCEHQHFSTDNIHDFDGLVQVTTADGRTPKIAVRVWLTRGPLGEGRIIDLPPHAIAF